jgi:hypothetical protein
VRLILGDTLRMAGDVAGALRTFAPLIEQAELTGAWPPRLSWRAAMLHYMRADYHRALELLDRAEPAATAPDADDALFQACRANVLHLLGRNDDAAVCAALAVDHATATGDDRAAASAHIAVALTSVGVHRDEQSSAPDQHDISTGLTVTLRDTAGFTRHRCVAPEAASYGVNTARP